MITVNNITKSFDDLVAVNDLSINIKKGSVYGLVGSNGAGKTTLLKILAGIYKEDSGVVKINDESVFENEELKSKISFIPDELYFYPNYTIESMAKFYKSIYKSWNDERYEKLKNVFKIDTKKRINRLSKGMKRQVALWLNLCTMPDLLILDEPIDGLDPVMRRKVKNLLFQDVAERNVTVIISSHNLRELEDICDHIAILHEGKLLVERDLDDLKSDVHKIQIAFDKEISNELLENIDILYKEKKGSVELYIVRGNKEEVLDKFNKFNPLILDILPLTLEEIFIYEMGDVGYEIQNVII